MQMASVRNSFTIVMVSTVFIVLAPLAWGQAIDIPLIVTGAEGPNTWMGIQYAHQFEADVDNSTAEMERDSLQVTAGHRIGVADGVYLMGNFGYHGSYYDFSNGNDRSQLLWDDIHQVTFVLGVGWTVGENWTLVALGMGRSAGEGGADFGDTLTGGAALVIEYRWSEELELGAIIGVLSQLEDSAAFLPLPTVDWRFAEGWRFQLGMIGLAHPGFGPEVSYRSDRWEFALGGSFQKRRYRLDDRAGPTNEGIGQEISFPIFARATFAPNEYMNFGLVAGVAVGGELRSGADGGSKVFKNNYDPAPIIGLQANFRF
jgi:hypothetical protein